MAKKSEMERKIAVFHARRAKEQGKGRAGEDATTKT